MMMCEKYKKVFCLEETGAVMLTTTYHIPSPFITCVRSATALILTTGLTSIGWEFTGYMAAQWKYLVLKKNQEAKRARSKFNGVMILSNEDLRRQVFADETLNTAFITAA
ncbi:predicted protein [Coccidioides posadasii str. Silveira]|uniref:Predicted protein n=1 Tax=Coccidioides posadasii (strain RMSCC 757 / Silveira) TaxID=443226 RepID=E9DA72_COCPS|nr:predicted protein [Coccidioides posadasii str. Silveira]